MPSAINVARRFIRLAGQGEEPDYRTHLRLQKLLYYVQGWSLAALGRPLFADRIEAWPEGPVVKELYHQYKGYEGNVIPSEAVAEPEGLGAEEPAGIASVWERYKGYSANALVEMTHQTGRGGKCGGASNRRTARNAEISHQAMAAWFGPQLARHAIPGLPVAAAYKAAAALDAAPGKAHDEVFAELRSRR